MREEGGRRRRVKGFDYGDRDNENDDNVNDIEDDNKINGYDNSNDVPKLYSSGYKLNGWAVHMCKFFFMMFRLSGLHTCIIWYPPGDKGRLQEIIVLLAGSLVKIR